MLPVTVNGSPLDANDRGSGVWKARCPPGNGDKLTVPLIRNQLFEEACLLLVLSKALLVGTDSSQNPVMPWVHCETALFDNDGDGLGNYADQIAVTDSPQGAGFQGTEADGVSEDGAPADNCPEDFNLDQGDEAADGDGNIDGPPPTKKRHTKVCLTIPTTV